MNAEVGRQEKGKAGNWEQQSGGSVEDKRQNGEHSRHSRIKTRRDGVSLSLSLSLSLSGSPSPLMFDIGEAVICSMSL